jgi:hypothetical protein
MSSEGNGAGRAADYSGGNPVTTRIFAVLAWLSSLGLFVWLVLDHGLSWWQKALCVVLTVPVIVVAWTLWGTAGAELADFARLRAAGRPAVAEIDGRFGCAPEPTMRVGALLKAVVDPSDNLFTLRPVRSALWRTSTGPQPA